LACCKKENLATLFSSVFLVVKKLKVPKGEGEEEGKKDF
jgi:hypothetical protein